MKNVLVLLVAVLCVQKSFSQKGLGIFGGRKVTIKDSPYLAAYFSSGVLRCGATIIGDKCVLTTGDKKT
jgi:hypothetical protein